jgi:hypothetical protein
MLRHDTRTDGQNWGKRFCLRCASDQKHLENCSCDCHFICIYGQNDPYPVTSPNFLKVLKGKNSEGKNAKVPILQNDLRY